MISRYYLRLPEPSIARGKEPELSFQALSPDGFAQELQHALREDALFQRWRSLQDDPDAVDPALGATDPAATVEGYQQHLAIELVASTVLSGRTLLQRLRWLAGTNWELRDVTGI